MRVRRELRGMVEHRATWVVGLALALGVGLTAACVIWFMTEAASSQADAARLRLSEALRGQLRLLRERVDADWRAHVVRLNEASGTGVHDFATAVTAGGLDSVVILAPDGTALYPAPLSAGRENGTPGGTAWQMARLLESSGQHETAAAAYAALARAETDVNRAGLAAQAHVRVLAAARRAPEALRAIDTHFSTGRLLRARDRHGRLIAGDAQLLALRLATSPGRAFDQAADRLAGLVNDYERTPMPSSQRLFLMRELQSLAGTGRPLPTFEAEQLAAEFVEKDGSLPSGEGLEPTRLPGVWKMALNSGALALLRTDTVTSLTSDLFQAQSDASGARFALLPPGGDGAMETTPASPLLPGWLIGVSLSDRGRFESVAARQAAIYLWAGSSAVAGLAIAGVLLWQSFRRQLRVSQMKTDLVAAVSHELRTPVASMRALVDLMLENPDLDRGRSREYLEMLAGQNARLSGLIEHFLSFTRVDRNNTRLVCRPLDAHALVRQVLAAAPVPHRFPGLSVDIAPDLPPLIGDEDALVTVLLNLLENAYKYTGPDKRIALRVLPDSGGVRFEVQDNGIGVARREQTRIFRPFYQVDQRLARESGGCGLGLSIVDFLVRAHGGRVTVESEPGAGSLFRIFLPAPRSSGAAVA